MVRTANTKTVIVGTLSGALITAALLAFDLWIFTYTDSERGFFGPTSDFAPIAAIIGAVAGFVAGIPLGFFLSLKLRGTLFGALAGVVESLAVLLFILIDGMPTDDARLALMFASFVAVGALAGFLTALILSAVTFSDKQKEHSYVVLGLQQNKTDESRL